jgi:hypothetical protein
LIAERRRDRGKKSTDKRMKLRSAADEKTTGFTENRLSDLA